VGIKRQMSIPDASLACVFRSESEVDFDRRVRRSIAVRVAPS